MKNMSIAGLVLAIILFFPTCDLVNVYESEKCPGAKAESNWVWNGGVAAPWSMSATFNVFQEGEYWIFQNSYHNFSDVCPEEHIKVSCTASSRPTERDINVRIRYRYGDFGAFGNTLTAVRYGTGAQGYTFDIPAGTNFGIKNAYPNGHGSFTLYDEFVMKSLVNENIDKALTAYKEYFSSIKVSYTYFKE